MNEGSRHRQNRELIDTLFQMNQQKLHQLGIRDASEKLTSERSVHDLRRSSDRRDSDEVSVLTLKESDGVLRWENGSGFYPHKPGKKRRAHRQGNQLYIPGKIIRQFKFENLPPNQVDLALNQLDATLNDHLGFYELVQSNNRWERQKSPIENPNPTGKILLIIHGTFSNTDNNLTAFNDTPFGRGFLNQAKSNYDQIIAFSHPTVGVSPFTNAVELGSFFRTSKADVDVICHSRGGLVSRWWNEIIESHSDRKVRIVFLGATLGGTSLASPYKLKAALDWLVNVSRGVTTGLQVGSAIFPVASGFFAAVMGINRIFTSIVGTAAKTPLLDAGIALVPGLNGQSRQGKNSELIGLRNSFDRLSKTEQSKLLKSYYFIGSNFEPNHQEPWWKFWKNFSKQAIFDFGADKIFQKSNDLVVETESMNELCDQLDSSHQQTLKKQTFNFAEGDKIHHLNYFSAQKTLKLIEKHLS